MHRYGSQDKGQDRGHDQRQCEYVDDLLPLLEAVREAADAGRKEKVEPERDYERNAPVPHPCAHEVRDEAALEYISHDAGHEER